MPTTQTFRLLLAAALLCGWSSCCTPPAEDYIQQPYVQQQMSGLANAFLALLPPDQASLPAAGAEARWLADTAVVQSAAIARDNRTVLFGWLNNILVNSNLRDRGLCWQVQQDLYRDLRRRPVKYFRIGLTIRDRGTGREHSCVYVNAAGKGLQGSIVLDAWKNCGHLVTLTQKDRQMGGGLAGTICFQGLSGGPFLRHGTSPGLARVGQETPHAGSADISVRSAE